MCFGDGGNVMVTWGRKRNYAYINMVQMSLRQVHIQHRLQERRQSVRKPRAR